MGSAKVTSEGEGTGVSQQLQKNKESEGVSIQPNHFVPSQKGPDVNKDLNTSLLAPSQKGVNIEKGPQLGTQDKGKDTIQLPPKPKMFQRRKKTIIAGSQGAHTVVQSLSSSLTEPLLNSAIDASPKWRSSPIPCQFLFQLHNLKFLQN